MSRLYDFVPNEFSLGAKKVLDKIIVIVLH
jgi:hypothetical protein